MSNIKIYKESSQQLSELSFVKDIPSQLKIKDISRNDFINQFGLIMVKIINHLGIKNAVTESEKEDIKEFILMRFKSLSLNEIEYAFKLERYSLYESKSSHYQLFNTDYVSMILNKYIQWKRKINFKNNLIAKSKNEKEVSNQEKKQLEFQAVNKSLEYFIEHRSVDLNRIYVYDILDKLGYMPTNNEEKRKIKVDAQLILEKDLTREKENKKSNSIDEKRQFDRVLEDVKNGISPKIIIKCKELVLSKFYRDLTLEKNRLNQFKKEFN